MITNKLFAIGIPTVNRVDLLNAALEYYLEHFPGTAIYVFDNGIDQDIQRHKNIYIRRTTGNQGCVKAWNWLATVIFEVYKFAWMLNDDVIVKQNEDKISTVIQDLRTAAVINSPVQWCSFVINKLAYKSVGPFDSSFHSYYADNDYQRRLKIANLELVESEALRPGFFVQSGSTNKDPMLNLVYEPDHQEYLRKWGGDPGKEKFVRPYNI